MIQITSGFVASTAVTIGDTLPTLVGMIAWL